MPENDEPTPDDGTGTSAPVASGPGTVEVETPRTRIQVAMIGAAGLVVVALITLIGTFVTRGGDSDKNADPPARPVITTPETSAPVGDTPCAPTRKAHGFSAAFVSPCNGAKLKSPYPVVTLKVPAYPKSAADGRLWVVVTILSNGQGTPLADKPTFAGYPVDEGQAKEVGATTWTKDLQIYRTCHDYGPAKILTYWLSPSGAKQADRWKPSVPITIPADSVQLDEVTVNMESGSC